MNKALLLASVVAVGVSSLTVDAKEALVFQESFANCKSTTIQGGYFTESLYFESASMADNDGWYTSNCYMSERAIKFSAKTKHGRAQSPAINLIGNSGDITVNFRAQTWSGDDLVINVEIDGVDGSVQTLDLNGARQISDRSLPCSTVKFTNVPTGSKLVFSGTGKEGGTGVTRFFLSDIQVLQDVPEATEVKDYVKTSTFYHHFNDIMAGSESENRTVTVASYGAGEAQLILPEKSNFKIVDKLDMDCEVPTSTYVLAFDPVNAGAKEDVATIKLGDYTANLILTGNAKVYAPQKGEAADVASDSFKATWAPQKGMDKLQLVVWTMEEGPLVAPDLMFSKYIEGKSNNRAVEIFNGTGRDVNLKGYYLVMENNGAGGLTANKFEFPDKVLAPGKTYTVANANFNAVRDIADRTIGYNDGGYANIMTFTGDDAIGLFNGEDVLIDLLGYESTDVNDHVSGQWGTDVSYYRRPECYIPTPKFYESQWIKHPMDYCENFGSHEMDAYGDIYKVVKTIELTDPTLTEYTVDGLQPSTTYHFALRGYSNDLLTPFGEESVCTTLGGSGVEEISAEANWTLQGNVLTLGEGAEAYTLDGRALGKGTVTLEGHGVVIVKTADRSFKAVY
ncbi:MAG: lamin tail domain-containing protein [Muribaculum sp.]|nr:lamin tail domain-containing protein [Muribaculum sp.]